MRNALAAIALAGVLAIAAPPAQADLDAERLPGWRILETEHSYAALVERLETAIAANKMGLVSRASATLGAKRVLNKTIPGNTVIGVYRPDYAVRMLEASLAAGIEAPIRYYVTENEDGSATLSYKTPSAVFAPYADGGEALKTLAEELDAIFATIAADATAR
ncbi:DUF302 domain-containing protein [Pelagibius sp.]|uniref:DUF302 domain-containing protein n=1 Tax=Pelagibius sp. TaxID=1931238 RepID=UPI003B502CEE